MTDARMMRGELPDDQHPLKRGLEDMTLRDWFAGQALAAITVGQGSWLGVKDAPELAVRAYAVADAMLAERSKP